MVEMVYVYVTYSLLPKKKGRKEGREGGRERGEWRKKGARSNQWASLKAYKYFVILITSP